MDCHKNARLTARSRELLARRVVEQGVTLSGAGTCRSRGPQFASAPAVSSDLQRAGRAGRSLAPAALDRLSDRAARGPEPRHGEPHSQASEAQPHPPTCCYRGAGIYAACETFCIARRAAGATCAHTFSAVSCSCF
jgi:hypothetical protein